MAENKISAHNQFYRIFQGIPLAKKISFIVILSLVAGGFVALLLWTNRPDYQVLFANLETNDASRISEKLKDERVPFHLENGGRVIMVPDEKVYELRLKLASEGLPRGQNVGFEILKNLPLGTTKFVEKLKYREALQGELARTISQFDSVAQVRVHIAPGGDSLFAGSEKGGTASVVLRLQPGRTIDRRQLQGIINLVACAVEGLKPDNVTVVDMDGGLLSKGGDVEDGPGLSGSHFEYRRKLEKSLENRIRTMLEPVVGSNKVVARVAADVDFKQVNISEESYDPDSAVVRSEHRQKESASAESGLATSAPKLKHDGYWTQGEPSGIPRKSEKENAVVKYEISKVNKKIVSSVGDIKRLSVAVVIDGPYVSSKSPNGELVRKFKPHSRKEMMAFQNMVKRAIGFDAFRGDKVSVSNIPFVIDNMVMPEVKQKTGWMNYVKKGTKPIFNILLILLFFLFAIKPFRSWLKQTTEYLRSPPLQEGAAVPELAAPTGEEEGVHIKKEQILDLTRTDPEKIVEVIRSWVQEGR